MSDVISCCFNVLYCFPSIVMSPEVGCNKLSIILARVLLPAPLLPIIAHNSPLSNSMFTCFSILQDFSCLSLFLFFIFSFEGY